MPVVRRIERNLKVTLFPLKPESASKPASAEFGACQVKSYSIDPGRKPCNRLICMPALVYPEKGILDNVVAIVTISKDSEGKVRQRIFEAPDNLGEPFFIVSLKGSHELFIGLLTDVFRNTGD